MLATTSHPTNLNDVQSGNLSGFLIEEPAEVYHAKAKEYLSSHQLGDFRGCPQLYHHKKLGIISDEDRPAYVLGRAVHSLTFGRARGVRVGVYRWEGRSTRKPAHHSARAPKLTLSGRATQTKEVLTDAQYALANFMAASVHGHPYAAELLSSGDPERVVRTSYCGLPCQIRMDWFDSQAGIVDLKTCDDLTWFEADARRYGYGHQAAFYRAVLAQVVGVWAPFHFIAVEKKPPYRAGVWKASENTLSAKQRENDAAIERLKRCRRARPVAHRL